MDDDKWDGPYSLGDLMTKLGIHASESRKTLRILNDGVEYLWAKEECSTGKWFIKRGYLLRWFQVNQHGEQTVEMYA
jgi:hypothetical protein